MNVRVIRETATSVTLGFDPVPAADGYGYYRDGVRVSRTFRKPLPRSVTFQKPDALPHSYGVAPLVAGAITAVTVPAAHAPYGTHADAGLFAGRGVMLGANPDVWDQAISMIRAGELDVVAVVPSTIGAQFKPARVVVWIPPEREPMPTGDVRQAENQLEWDSVVGDRPPGIVLNDWRYGRFPARTVAFVEAYYNEGQGVDFGVYANYMAQGASAVIPVCGGYSAAGRTDAESAAIYQQLATWSGGPFPGFWMYAGESPLTSESVDVLKAWKP